MSLDIIDMQLIIYFFILGIVSGFFAGYTVKDLALEEEREKRQRIVEAYNKLYLEGLRGKAWNSTEERQLK